MSGPQPDADTLAKARAIFYDFAREWTSFDVGRGDETALAITKGGKIVSMTKRPRYKHKPLSPRRAREFRDRWLKGLFGDRKARTKRYAWLRSQGVDDAWLKAMAKPLSGEALQAAIS